MATSFYKNPRDGLFAKIDANKDDQISFEEWRDAFDMIDADKDGNISRKEWMLHQGETIVFDAIAMTTKERAPCIRRDHWEKAFDVLDRDGNGFLNYVEWVSIRNRMAVSKKLIHSMSTDNNARRNPRTTYSSENPQTRRSLGITSAGFDSQQPKPLPAVETKGLFANIDQSKDGEISIDEWTQAFDIMDIDNDGVVSRKEWWLHQGDTDMFDAISCKKNKAAITRKEWREAFDLLDADGTGRIAYDEWLSFRIRKGGVNRMYHFSSARHSFSGKPGGVARAGPPASFVERQQADLLRRQEKFDKTQAPKLEAQRAEEAHREALKHGKVPKRSSMQDRSSKRSPQSPESAPLDASAQATAWDPEGEQDRGVAGQKRAPTITFADDEIDEADVLQ